ncbi:uncharacterized protein N7477_006745 [Penicillium maclennaniae]|uniref:uncharacterized protein n=1 Tax=Penicillium maclennaniae TaxID=1343394 RepID=UPI00253FDFD1|nr:uncharacterized protein N7477_006745 [Penicillium maclennaniae]KAJ5668175.1 hypothetical protein N7477_006745 [Penicillium maclennaniae]
MSSFNQETDHFKVLIAGGSLVGLGLALAFERAGIDYELFEKGDFAPQLGGLYWTPPAYYKNSRAIGRVAGHREAGNIEEILQRPIVFLERCKALEVLHSHVKDKSKLHSQTAVAEYEETAEGIVLTTETGAQHHGHILIGADGIHSKVRKLMADKIGVTNQSLAQDINEAFTSEYNCIFAISPNKQYLPDGMVHNVYYNDYSAVAAAGVPGLVFWFLFVKDSKVKRTPHCPRITDADANAYIQKYGSSLVGPGYTVEDLWESRVKASMVPLEEGVIPQWCHNRVVLVGDSVHKATINPGLGGNTAYEGIARLTNGLIPLLKKNPKPSLEQLTEVFNQYFIEHSPRAKTVVDLSGSITRYEAQDTWVLKFAARHIVPWISDRIKANLYAIFSKAGPWLEYLPLPARDIDLKAVAEKPAQSIAPVLIAGTVMVGAAAIIWQTCRGPLASLVIR